MHQPKRPPAPNAGLLAPLAAAALAAAFAAAWIPGTAGAQQQQRQQRRRPAVGAAAQRPKIRALPAGLTLARVRAHDRRPAHVRGIEIEETDPAREILYTKRPLVLKKFEKTPRPDIDAFGTALHAIFKDNVTGYAYQIRRNGAPIYAGAWEWAQTPADRDGGWDADTRMHIASVSKFLTAVGMLKALDDAGVSLDAKIGPYLPAAWSQGSNVDDITFRHLLTHQTGFDSGEGADKYRTDYDFMKRKVAAGVSGVGTPTGYENMNFGLCRLLIPVVNGDIERDAVFMEGNTDVNDSAWDAVTILHYRKFLQDELFTPAGVRNAGFIPSSGGKRALGYKYPHGNDKGWDSGDLSTVAAAVGWRLSLKELLDVAHHVRRRGTVLSPDRAQFLLDARLGIDQKVDTPAGPAYNKNGKWGGGSGTEQSVLYFFPQNIEVAVYVNSPLGTENFSLRDAVKNAYINSLKE
jgi:CubicO group peptidase (beta-lactamase class C family)